MIFCIFCGSKISDSEICRQRMRAHVGQTPRWINYYKCDTCGKYFDYRLFITHKKKFEKIIKLNIET